MTQDKYPPDLDAAEDALITADGRRATRTRLPFGHDALWVPAQRAAAQLAAAA